jgi:cytochrome b
MLKQGRINQSTRPGARRPRETLRVWDLFVRTFHWMLVLSFGTAWLSSHSSEGIHHFTGYVAAGLILIRLPWGVLGPPYARFSQFARNPAVTVRYLLAMLRGSETRFIGHNPAGGAMVLTLMAATVTTSLTGWMMTTSAYFGVDWVESAHSISAHGLLLLVFVHVGGVILASIRHRENLVVAMITGRKRKAEAEDIT